MKKNTWIFIVCFLLVTPVLLSAQVAVEIEKLLETEALSYEEAARFVLMAADILPEAAVHDGFMSSFDAFSLAEEWKWLPKKAVAGGEARLDGVSLLVMKSFGIKGGLFYSLFKNPHYAYRELVYREVIQGKADPQMAVSGDTLLFMINRLLAAREEEAVLAAENAGQDSQEAVEDKAAASRRAAELQQMAVDINAQLVAQAVTDTSARVTDEGVTISLSNIQFTANSAELPESEKRKLREISQILQLISRRRILITGHTALAGTEGDRLTTSLERAQAVASYLISLGARRADEVFVQGHGSDRPIASNNTPEGMALNRRVEITILENQ